MAFPGAYYIHDGSVFRVRVISEYFATNTNTATIQVREDVGSGTWTIRYYILVGDEVQHENIFTMPMAMLSVLLRELPQRLKQLLVCQRLRLRFS